MHAYIHSTIMIDYVELHNKRYIIKNSKHKWPVDQQMQYPGKLFRGKQFKPYLIAWKFLTRRETASSCLKSFVCELHGAVSETKRKKRQREDNTKAAQRPTQSEALRIASWCFNGKLWKVMESWSVSSQALSLWIATPRSASMDVTFEIPWHPPAATVKWNAECVREQTCSANTANCVKLSIS